MTNGSTGSEDAGRGFIPAALEARLEKLERENRRLWPLVLAPTLLSVTLGVMLAIGATKQAAVPDVLRAHKLEIVDDKGTKRADIAAAPYGPDFRLYDENGKTRIDLLVTTEGPVIWLMDEKGFPRAALGAARLNPMSPSDTRRADESSLILLDKNGKTTLWRAPPEK